MGTNVTAGAEQMRDDREVAYHEAGHVVVAKRFRLAVHKATIVSGEGYEGYMRHTLGVSAARIEMDSSDAVTLKMEGLVCVAFAGHMAGKRVSPSADDDTGTTDRKSAIDLLFRLARPEHIPAYEEHLRNRTDCILDREWHRVEAVAQALLQHKTLGRKALRDVIEDAERIHLGYTAEQWAEQRAMFAALADRRKQRRRIRQPVTT